MAKKAPPMLAWDTSLSRLQPERLLKEVDWFDLTNPVAWHTSESAARSLTGPDQPPLCDAETLRCPVSDQPEKC